MNVLQMHALKLETAWLSCTEELHNQGLHRKNIFRVESDSEVYNIGSGAPGAKETGKSRKLQNSKNKMKNPACQPLGGECSRDSSQ